LAKHKIEAELNEPQLQAVRCIEGPVLIIAGAGSGKTRVITYRIAHILDKGIPQNAILALTFTNKAAQEMRNRARQITGKKLQSLTISTFHAFGLSILREHIEKLDNSPASKNTKSLPAFRKNFSIYDETDKLSLIKESLRECRMASKKVNIYNLGQVFSNIKTGKLNWKTPEAYGINALSEWEPVFNEYQDGLRVFNAVDFDDLLALPLELFVKNPDIPKAYQKQFRYIMVDEFQDTSLQQYRMMRHIAHRNICVVGDDDQSIYSWRGANYENLVLFEKDFPGAVEIKLEQNYRSTTTILEAANMVISHNKTRKPKNLWSGNHGGKPVELYFPENESAEADFIAAQIRHLMIMENYTYQDFGILIRTNSLARNIEEAFLAANIPYKVSGGTSFFQRKEIKDIISYLRVIANPDDDISLLRIINTPRRGIGRTTIAALSEASRENRTSLYDILCRFNNLKENTQQNLFSEIKPGKQTTGDLYAFMNLIESHRDEILERKTSGSEKWQLADKIRRLTESIDYWSYLVLEHGKEEKIARWKFANINHLIQMVTNWENDPDNPDTGLYSWLNRISLITRDDGEDDLQGKAGIMTIHSAKGLEFPVVFIAGAEKGIIPHERSLQENEGDAGSIEEERRLFYVAITRARDKLFITSCKNRRHLNNTIESSPSPFLNEIPPHLMEIHQTRQEAADVKTAEQFLAQIRLKFQSKQEQGH
jgi:DNA helicase-2/ATP-dependent DNA helicase PcrA